MIGWSVGETFLLTKKNPNDYKIPGDLTLRSLCYELDLFHKRQ